MYILLLSAIQMTNSNESNRTTSDQAQRHIRRMDANRRNRNTNTAFRSPYSSPPYTLSSRPAPCPQKPRNNSIKSEVFSRCVNRSESQNASINRLKALFTEMSYKHYQTQSPPPSPSKRIRAIYKGKTSRAAHNRSVRFLMTPDTKDYIPGWGANSPINIFYPGESPVQWC